MICAIFFMNAKGDLLISRIYRDDVMKGVTFAIMVETYALLGFVASLFMVLFIK